MSKDLLLVIDMQNVYDQGGQWYCPSIEKAKKSILSLLDKQDPSYDIVFTKFIEDPNPYGIWNQYNIENEAVNHDVYANEMIEELKSYSYPIYEKSVYSSLGNPSIVELGKKANRVVVTGVVAECCVLSTVMQLIDEGIYVIYLTDGVAGISDETEKAVETILMGLSPLHVSLMTTQEYLKQNNH